jgi:hypothetical protein
LGSKKPKIEDDEETKKIRKKLRLILGKYSIRRLPSN